MPIPKSFIKLGVPYVFGGRKPFVPIRYTKSADSKRVVIMGYSPRNYKEYMKFHTLATPVKRHKYKTVAEVEHTPLPRPEFIRINRNCTIKEVRANA